MAHDAPVAQLEEPDHRRIREEGASASPAEFCGEVQGSTTGAQHGTVAAENVHRFAAADLELGGHRRRGSLLVRQIFESSFVIVSPDPGDGTASEPSITVPEDEIYLSATREDAEKAYETFLDLYQAKYPKAVKCLSKDREELFAFYNFPAEHWAHLRTTNPIESTFATVRHRHRQTKGNGSRKATLGMVFKLLTAAESGWRRLNGYRLLDKVVQGVIFKDGIDPEKAAKKEKKLSDKVSEEDKKDIEKKEADKLLAKRER